MKPTVPSFLVLLALCTLVCRTDTATAGEPAMQFGFSKLDITPEQPMRLSGYGDRTEPYTGIEQKLWIRTMVLKPAEGELAALVAVDTIGLPGVLTTKIARRLEKEHGISRERFVQSSSHSHTAPQIADAITNIFAHPLSDQEQANMEAYTGHIADQIVAGVGKAIDDLAPGRMYLAEGKVGFAANRRVLADGRWTGFGVTDGAAVDHSLPLLKITDAQGQLRGVVFNYACHCTTLFPGFNRVCGDWAGYSAEYIEERHDDIVALCTIGCGADANPEPRGELQMAQAHGRAISLEVEKLLEGEMREITSAPTASFGYAGLPVDRPSIREVRDNLDHESPQVRRHAQNMVDTFRRMGRLPESYPMPIQTWKFGDELTMVFLGGEVVVDYAHRLSRELEGGYTWVTAYANDVFGYVASERIRREGGYEVDYSMIYYNQPGPWAEGTEEVVVTRVHEILSQPQSERALSPDDAVKSFQLPEGFEIDVAAAEPLIVDPVSFDFGADGRLWVVQMSDYPRGLGDRGQPGGVVKVLEDTDGDGRFDSSTVFLDGLSYPTGVMPWRDGVLVSAAPEILYAEDTDGDGRADVREVLFSGFVEANPQHRVNGFAYGLDNWVYIGSGDSNGEIRSEKTGEVINMSGRDLRIRPDDGAMDLVSGRTQYGRTRNDWGDWVGSSNNNPVYHFVVSDRYLRRNRFVAAPDPKVDLIQPSPAPPVYPASRTVDRFNDLYDANRFTSGCGPVFFRDMSLGDEMARSVLVCEPVHNLVHRTLVETDAVALGGDRHPGEQQSEFLASTDVWSRPVKLATGPDGALWVADMYRYVIEHPEWIPEEWQRRLDIRAGEDKGRIYRVYRSGQQPWALPKLDELSPSELVSKLESPNGWIRDTAQRLLVHAGDKNVAPQLQSLVAESSSPVARIHALGTLDGLGALDDEQLLTALADDDWRVQRFALQLCEPRINERPELAKKVAELTDHPDVRLRFQLALTLGEWNDSRAGELLGQLAAGDLENHWMRTAVLSSASGHAEQILAQVLQRSPSARGASWAQLTEDLISTALGNQQDEAAQRVLAAITAQQPGGVQSWQMGALSAFLEAAQRRNLDLAELRAGGAEAENAWNRAMAVYRHARELSSDDAASVEDRQTAVRLLAGGIGDQADDNRRLASLLSPQSAPSLQSAALSALSDVRSDDVPNLLLENWQAHSPNLREQIFTVLLRRRDWTEALMSAIENGEVLPIDLDTATRSRLLSHGDDEIRKQAGELLASLVSKDREQVIADYDPVLELEGNLIRGAAVFGRRCATCHRFRELGNEVGPNLAALRDKSSRHLLVSVLDPNRAVERAYLEYVVATVDGKMFNGMVVAESTNSFTMAQPSGHKQVILRADVDEFSRTGKSFMPEGLEKELSPQDLADAFAFLRSAPNAAADTTTDAARKLLHEAGANGCEKVTSQGGLQTRVTWVGEIDIPVATTERSRQPLEWTTAATPHELEGGTVMFRMPAAVAAGTENGAAPRFALAANGQRLLEFSASTNDTVHKSSDGRATLRYLSMQQSDDMGSGVLEIELAANLVDAGKPVKFQLIPTDDDSASGWLGVWPAQ